MPLCHGSLVSSCVCVCVCAYLYLSLCLLITNTHIYPLTLSLSFSRIFNLCIKSDIDQEYEELFYNKYIWVCLYPSSIYLSHTHTHSHFTTTEQYLEDLFAQQAQQILMYRERAALLFHEMLNILHHSVTFAVKVLRYLVHPSLSVSCVCVCVSRPLTLVFSLSLCRRDSIAKCKIWED